MRKSLILFCLAVGLFLFSITQAADTPIKLQQAHIYPSDKPSLQRGAKLFMNYCSGCHSLQYMRYQRIAEDLGISEKLLKENLIFSAAKPADPVESALLARDAKNWFGVVPPDLTLIAKIRGVDWLYTFLQAFYQDNNRPWGVNNLLFPEVAMPHVLAPLQGIQVYSALKPEQPQPTLSLEQPGLLTTREYDQAINDLVNFLAYTAAPEKLKRQYLGMGVLLFLAIFAILTYLLKREYWKKINERSF
ncbi:MAG: cytochrome [Gammaproteobacteria bacterium]|nr:cytochrome [Gammaproteobacteria bacterium]